MNILDDELETIPGLNDNVAGLCSRCCESDSISYDIDKINICLGNLKDSELFNYIFKNYNTKNISFVRLLDKPSRDDVAEYDEDIMFCDGLDDALVGVKIGFNDNKNLAVYDYELCVDVLMETQSWERDEAVEYLEFNTVGAYVGEYTPCFLYPI